MSRAKDVEITTRFKLRDSVAIANAKKLPAPTKETKKVDTEYILGYEDREQDENVYLKPARDVRGSTKEQVYRDIEEHTKEKASYYPVALPFSTSGESLVGVPRLPIECEMNSDGSIPNCGVSNKKIESSQFQYRG